MGLLNFFKKSIGANVHDLYSDRIISIAHSTTLSIEKRYSTSATNSLSDNQFINMFQEICSIILHITGRASYKIFKGKKRNQIMLGLIYTVMRDSVNLIFSNLNNSEKESLILMQILKFYEREEIYYQYNYELANDEGLMDSVFINSAQMIAVILDKDHDFLFWSEMGSNLVSVVQDAQKQRSVWFASCISNSPLDFNIPEYVVRELCK
jgi:hypothetical protein